MSGSLEGARAWVEKHPYVTAGAVFIVGAILIYLYYSGGQSSGQSTQDQGAASDQSLLQAQLQSEAIQAQAAAAQSAQQSQLAASTAAINGQVTVQTTQANDALQAALDADKTQATLASITAGTNQAGIAAQKDVSLAGINAQDVLAALNSKTAISESSIAANENTTIAGFAKDVSIANLTSNSQNLATLLNAQNFQAWDQTYQSLNQTWLQGAFAQGAAAPKAA